MIHYTTLIGAYLVIGIVVAIYYGIKFELLSYNEPVFKRIYTFIFMVVLWPLVLGIFLCIYVLFDMLLDCGRDK